mgnify:CR=1 FL=1
MFHSVIEAMVGQMLHNLFEHQICISLVGCTMHLFLNTQDAFSLPRSHDIQVFFSNLHHSANPKDVEPSSLLFISILNNVMKYIIIDDRLLVTIRMKVQDAKMSNLEYYIANVNPQCW